MADGPPGDLLPRLGLGLGVGLGLGLRFGLGIYPHPHPHPHPHPRTNPDPTLPPRPILERTATCNNVGSAGNTGSAQPSPAQPPPLELPSTAPGANTAPGASTAPGGAAPAGGERAPARFVAAEAAADAAADAAAAAAPAAPQSAPAAVAAATVAQPAAVAVAATSATVDDSGTACATGEIVIEELARPLYRCDGASDEQLEIINEYALRRIGPPSSVFVLDPTRGWLIECCEPLTAKALSLVWTQAGAEAAFRRLTAAKETLLDDAARDAQVDEVRSGSVRRGDWECDARESLCRQTEVLRPQIRTCCICLCPCYTPVGTHVLHMTLYAVQYP